jgi:hypothetical protein
VISLLLPNKELFKHEISSVSVFVGDNFGLRGFGPDPNNRTNPDLLTRVSDPDPDLYWIRIQSGQWIRIRFRNPDPDPGGQK